MKIHAIQTGTVAITTAWREGYLVAHDPDTGRRLADRRVMEPVAKEVAA